MRAAHPVFASAEPEYGYRSGLNSLPHYLSYYTPCAMVKFLVEDNRIELLRRPCKGPRLPLHQSPKLTCYNFWNIWNCSRTAIQLFKKTFSLLRCIRIDSFLFFTTGRSYSCFIHWHIVSSNGRSTRIRTLDPLVPNQVRYQTAPHSETISIITPTYLLSTVFDHVKYHYA